MSIPAGDDEGSNIIRLNFPARAVSVAPLPVPPFILEAKSGGWKIHPSGPVPDAAQLVATADMLRDIARKLLEMAQDAAGQPVKRCIAEFVLYETGGIDHWVESGADRTRLRLGLRTAISTIRDP